VGVARAVVYLNSLANEVSYACRFRQVEILPRALDAIACTMAHAPEDDEVELDEATSDQYRRALHAVDAADLDLQATVAIELGDSERMSDVEALAMEKGHIRIAQRIAAGRQLEATKASVRSWLETKQVEAKRARKERMQTKRAEKKKEREEQERKRMNQSAFEAWLAADKERRVAEHKRFRKKPEGQTIEEFMEEEQERQRQNEEDFKAWKARKAEAKKAAARGGKPRPAGSPSGKSARMAAAMRASRELEEKAFAVLEKGWSYDVKVPGPREDKKAAAAAARER